MILKDEEVQIKDKVKINRENPEIYQQLQKMIFIFLRRVKAPGSLQDLEEVSYTMAGDIFLKIVQGEDINHFLGYFEHYYKGYFRSYYDSEKYGTLQDPLNSHIMTNISSTSEYRKVLNKQYLTEIEKVIDTVMNESCKYRYDSKAYLNLKISLVLSLIKGVNVNFHLDPEQLSYLKLMRAAVQESIRKEGLDIQEDV